MHPRIELRRNGVLISQAVASDHLVIERIGRVEALLSHVDASVARSGQFDEILDFCRNSQAALRESSPFTEEGRSLRGAISLGFAELDRLMRDTLEGLRQLQG